MNNPTEQSFEQFYSSEFEEGRPFNEGWYLRRETLMCWESWQAAHAQLMPLLVEAQKTIRKANAQLRILIPENGMVNDERMTFIAIDETLAKLNAAIGEGK